MFVNDTVIDAITGRTVWTTIDRERYLELRALKVDYDYSVFALKVEGRDVVISAKFRHAGEGKTIIQYSVVGMAGSQHDFPAYSFSSREDKLRIAKYVEEALRVHGRHYSLSPGMSVEVTFADPVLSFSKGA